MEDSAKKSYLEILSKSHGKIFISSPNKTIWTAELVQWCCGAWDQKLHALPPVYSAAAISNCPRVKVRSVPGTLKKRVTSLVGAYLGFCWHDGWRDIKCQSVMSFSKHTLFAFSDMKKYLENGKDEIERQWWCDVFQMSFLQDWIWQTSNTKHRARPLDPQQERLNLPHNLSPFHTSHGPWHMTSFHFKNSQHVNGAAEALEVGPVGLSPEKRIKERSMSKFFVTSWRWTFDCFFSSGNNIFYWRMIFQTSLNESRFPHEFDTWTTYWLLPVGSQSKHLTNQNPSWFCKPSSRSWSVGK